MLARKVLGFHISAAGSIIARSFISSPVIVRMMVPKFPISDGLTNMICGLSKVSVLLYL